MPLVRITPAHGYIPGHIETTLIQQGVKDLPPRTKDGSVTMHLTQLELDKFLLKGSSHRVEFPSQEAAPAAVAAPSSPTMTISDPPTAEDIMRVINCPQDMAELIVKRNALIALGMSPEQADHAMDKDAMDDEDADPSELKGKEETKA